MMLRTPGQYAALRRQKLPSHLLPLLADRTPFAGLSDPQIEVFLAYYEQFPEALGRLSTCVRLTRGQSIICPVEFTIYESHIDLADTDAALESKLFSLGFEPDHFITLNPAEYRYCYTLKWELDRTTLSFSARSAALKRELIERTKAAIEYISNFTAFAAYVEAECYTNMMKRRFLPYCDFDVRLYESCPLRRLSMHAAATNGKSGGKVVDLHIKLPMPQKGAEFANIDRPRQALLAQLLRETHCYEIQSFAGNRIFTIQLARAPAMNRLFREMCEWAALAGGISSMNLETCMLFWARDYHVEDRIIISPVPPIWDMAITAQ